MKVFYPCLLKQAFIGIFLFYFSILISAQNVIDINSNSTKHLQAQEHSDPFVKELFKDADRYRVFEYNPQLVGLTSNNIGDTLLLNFFDDKQYKAVIQHAGKNISGRTSITTRIVDSEFACCYLTVSPSTISITAELPAKNEYFFASVKNGVAYISQVEKSELDKTTLPGMEVEVSEAKQKSKDNRIKKNDKEIEDPVIIDLLYVYTPEAAQWALEDWRVTDIFDLIDQANQRSNVVAENSETGIFFRIVYIHLTDYVEDNTIEDLFRITDPWDGYMDEVHVLRDQYYADQIVFIPKVSFTGGIAWLLMDEYGFDPDYYAVSLSRVQQSSWTNTVIHEIGHNMGAHHHAEQNVQPGPGLFYYSSGWRGVVNEQYYCSVMTYSSGTYFSDGHNSIEIPYFSSPSILYENIPIGNSYTDNALTLKLTKGPVSRYRINPNDPVFVANLSLLNFNEVFLDSVSASKSFIITGMNLIGGITYAIEGTHKDLFIINEESWDFTSGGVISVTFSPIEEGEHNAAIVFTTMGMPEVVITLKGTGIPNVGVEGHHRQNTEIYSYLNNIIIQKDDAYHKTVEIFDMIGQVIFQSVLKSSRMVIPLQVKNGIYFIRLISQNGEMIVRKLLISKQ